MRRIRQAYKVIGVATLAALVLLPNLQVVMRGVFEVPLVGAEELARYLLIVVTFLAVPLAAAEGGHIRMEEFQARLPARLRLAVRIAINLLAIAAFGAAAIAAVITLFNNLENTTPTLSIPFYIFVLPVLLGMTMLVVEAALSLRNEIRNRKS